MHGFLWLDYLGTDWRLIGNWSKTSIQNDNRVLIIRRYNRYILLN